jgi:hypothetical protein
MSIHSEIAAHFDAASERIRLQALADQRLADNRLPPPESVTEQDALIDAGVDDGPDDSEIIAMVAKHYGWTCAATVDRLQSIDFHGERKAT